MVILELVLEYIKRQLGRSFEHCKNFAKCPSCLGGMERNIKGKTPRDEEQARTTD